MNNLKPLLRGLKARYSQQITKAGIWCVPLLCNILSDPNERNEVDILAEYPSGLKKKMTVKYKSLSFPL